MKTLSILLVFLFGCGSPPAAPVISKPVQTLDSPAGQSSKTWTIEITGDGSTFSLSMITDYEQTTLAPTLVNGLMTYSVQGVNLTSSGVTRTNTTAQALLYALYENGALVEQGTLSNSGEFHTFPQR